MPRVRSLDDPASRLAADDANEGLLAASSDVRTDPPQPNGRSHVRVVVALVQAEVFRTPRPAGTANDDGIKDIADHRAVRHVGASDQGGEGNATTVGQNVAFDAAFRAVRWIWAREVPPFGAFTEALSRELHFQAMPRRPS